MVSRFKVFCSDEKKVCKKRVGDAICACRLPWASINEAYNPSTPRQLLQHFGEEGVGGRSGEEGGEIEKSE